MGADPETQLAGSGRHEGGGPPQRTPRRGVPGRGSGTPPGPPLGPPPEGGPGGARGAPRGARAPPCTFLRVFNNSPSRDSLGHFFPLFSNPVFGQFGVSQLTCRISGGSIAHLWRSMSQPMPSMSQPISSMSQPMCVGSVIIVSLRLYVSIIANVYRYHCVGDNIIAIVYRYHCDCISLSLRMYIVVIALMLRYHCECISLSLR